MIPLEFMVKTAACQLFVVVWRDVYHLGPGQLVAPAAEHRVAASTGLSWQEESEVLLF